jgi:hypothetical protein
MRGFKPETWTDEKIVSVSPLARLLFLGMWNYACDNGHVDDSPVQLKMRILPADNCDAAALVVELVNAGLVIRKDGYLKVSNLPKHQNIDRRFLTFCDHCEHDEHLHFEPTDKLSRTTGKGAHKDPDPASARRAPDGHTPGSHGEVKGSEVKGSEDMSTQSADDRPEFAEFWQTYPRKDGKRKAETKYRAAVKRAKPETILAGAQRYRDDPNRRPQFTAMATTWLERDGWDDGPIPGDSGNAAPGAWKPPPGSNLSYVEM